MPSIFYNNSSLAIPHYARDDSGVAAEICLLLLTSISLSRSNLIAVVLLLLRLSLRLRVADRLLDLLLDQPLLVNVGLIERVVRIVHSDVLVAILEEFIESALDVVPVRFEGGLALRFGEAHVHKLSDVVRVCSISGLRLSRSVPLRSISEGHVDPGATVSWLRGPCSVENVAVDALVGRGIARAGVGLVPVVPRRRRHDQNLPERIMSVGVASAEGRIHRLTCLLPVSDSHFFSLTAHHPLLLSSRV